MYKLLSPHVRELWGLWFVLAALHGVYGALFFEHNPLHFFFLSALLAGAGVFVSSVESSRAESEARARALKFEEEKAQKEKEVKAEEPRRDQTPRRPTSRGEASPVVVPKSILKRTDSPATVETKTEC
jgi:hypothetical protein